jgi:hypothetical protein
MDKERKEEGKTDTRPIPQVTSEQSSSRRPWIKPVFESEPLKKALSNGQNPDIWDGFGCGS